MKCTQCSKGCKLSVRQDAAGERLIGGHGCDRGQEAGLRLLEAAEHREVYKVFVPLKNGYMKHILVISDQPIERVHFKLLDALLADCTLTAPVEKGAVVCSNPLGLEVNLVAARRQDART